MNEQVMIPANLVRWYPFQAGKKVLVIGTAQEALTSWLAAAGCEVQQSRTLSRAEASGYDVLVVLGAPVSFERAAALLQDDGVLLFASDAAVRTSYQDGAAQAISKAVLPGDLALELVQGAGFVSVYSYAVWPDYEAPLEMTLLQEGAQAGSYLIAAYKKQTNAPFSYCKCNSQRKPQYQILTMMLDGEQGAQVVKLPMTEAAQAHLQQMKREAGARSNQALMEELYGTSGPICVVDTTAFQNGVASPFVTGRSPYDTLDLQNENKDAVLASIQDMIDQLSAYDESCFVEFEKTDTFEQIFPNCQVPSGKALRISNLDAIPGNFLINEEGIWSIDYEWVMDCPIPERFVRYRMALYTYTENHTALETRWSQDQFLADLGFTGAECWLYQKMEDQFQEYVLGEKRCFMSLAGYESATDTLAGLKQLQQQLQEKEAYIERLHADIASRTADIDRLNAYIEDLRYAIKHPVKGLQKLKG